MTAKRAPVVLLWGEDGFLLREAALDLLGGVRPVEVEAREWRGGELADLATPSMFGEQRALMVTDARRLSKAALDEIAAYLRDPLPEAALVLVAEVSERASVPAALLRTDTSSGIISTSCTSCSRCSRSETRRWPCRLPPAGLRSKRSAARRPANRSSSSRTSPSPSRRVTQSE